MTELLQQLPNGGAVVAVILVMWLAMKRQERSDERLEKIVAKFTDELALSRRQYLEHLNEHLNRSSSSRKTRGVD